MGNPFENSAMKPVLMKKGLEKENNSKELQENKNVDIEELVLDLQKKFTDGRYINELGNEVEVVHSCDEDGSSITFNRLEKIGDRTQSTADFFFSKKWNRVDDIDKLEKFMSSYKRV